MEKPGILKVPSSIYVRIAIALGSMAIYTAAFLVLNPLTGMAAGILMIIPMAVGGWLLGVRGSLFFGIFSSVLNYFLFRHATDSHAGAVIPTLINGFSFTLIAMLFGWIKEFLDQANLEAETLQGERKSLREEILRRREAEDRLTDEAFHDPLTDLPNRRLFFNRLEHALEWNKRHPDHLFGVVYLDFDRFKVINDSLGHSVGDLLLVSVARHLRVSVRSVDTVARMGGDEFAILLEAANSNEEIIEIVERLQESFVSPFELRGNSVIVSASFGIVLNLVQYKRLEDVLRDADIAMYSAKADGRNRYKVFDLAMRKLAEGTLIMESALHNAIQNGEFRIYYQPILSLRTQQITGFEALLRWEHPQKGLLLPEEFLKVAEESGLIVPIGNWVLLEACRQMKQWQTKIDITPPLTISVNLSNRQFVQPDLIQKIESVLKETELPAESLLLELTEMTMIEDIESAAIKIDQFRKLGVGVEIDDFGTGYSSLGYLRHLPVNSIKIDRSFTSSIGISKTGIPIIRAIIVMANSLDMKVIAEGIETSEQLKNLMDLNCDFGQGFFFNSPIDHRAAEELIRERGLNSAR